MSINEQDQAVLLLTVWFNKPQKGEPKPLSPKEWGRFALWLKENSLSPRDLLSASDVAAALYDWSDRTIDAHRIRSLLGRAAALGIALERWQRAGIWIMTRSDTDYPAKLKRNLKTDAPPVLFGSGNRQLLGRGGIAVVGSRDAGVNDLEFTTHLSHRIAADGRSVISGGARGVDETAMLAAIQHGGTAVGILADSLIRTSSSAKYRSSLMDNSLALISPFNPDAGFDVGNAMARNKYIYSLSDAAIVVSASEGRGGTWSGAVEALKHAWVPVWTKAHTETQSASEALDRLGARRMDESEPIASLLTTGETSQIQTTPPSPAIARPFALELEQQVHVVHSGEQPADYVPAPNYESPIPECEAAHPENSSRTGAITISSASVSLYDFFLCKLAEETRDTPLAAEAIQERLEITRSQLVDWLKRGVASSEIEKHVKPVRFQVVNARQRALTP